MLGTTAGRGGCVLAVLASGAALSLIARSRQPAA
jgi:hypothetical protein